jgi:hypothetical protein
MHQILQQLQNGTTEVVQDNGDGTLVTKVTPPSALQIRAARLIVQIINERDQMSNANNQLTAINHSLHNDNVTLNNSLQEALKQVDTLKQELNIKTESIPPVVEPT